MDESPACLVRSFSQPAGTSSDPKEEDPLRALTTSISFGRFMSESLSWEKWSSFSCNRHLEEAEKFSKPGSVAEMKAYFEDRHKKIAAKKAAALLEQQNSLINDFHEAGIGDENHESPSTVSESPKSDGNEAIDIKQGNVAHNAEPIFPVEANVWDKLKIEEVEEAELSTEKLVIPENPIQIKLSNQLENVGKHSKIMSIQQEKDSAEQGNLSTSKKKQSVRSSMSSTNRQPPNFRSKVKLSPVQPSKAGNPTQTTKMTARESVEKKRSAISSLHMSINFTSRAGETSKASSTIQKIGSLKNIRNSVKTSRESSTTMASMNVLSVHPSTYPSERARNKIPDDCSVSERRAADGKSQSPSIEHFNSSGASGCKARPPVVPSSFSLRCEERAAKRKEKLEEKLNTTEAGKVHHHAKSQEKRGDDFKKMRQSTCFMVKSIPNCPRERESPSNYKNKVPLTRPRSPKLGRKTVPGLVQNTGSRPPWRASVEIDGTQNARKRSIQTPKHSSNPLLRKSMRENASPNVQI